MYRSPRLQDNEEPVEQEERPVSASKREPVWWMSWEFYLIVLLAVGLRLYRIDTAQYMTDHNALYQLAYDAVAHGLWPISANGASTGVLLSPLFVYIMMIPAAITPNPVAGNILIALCNIIAVLLTYIFVRCYYGRLTGAISALLYATAVNTIVFSRDIWQPDMLPLFVVLLLFVLFRGVVERKHYWFLPSVLLIGVMYQFHITVIYLIVLLLVAMILGFKTIRWQEPLLALLGLLLLFAPYIYLEYHNHFTDIRMLFHTVGEPAVFNGDVLQLYHVFVSSYVFNPLHQQAVQHFDTHLIPSNEQSILLTTPLHFIAQFSVPESWLMVLLVVGGIVTLIVQIVWAEYSLEQRGLVIWCKSLLASPRRKGLILLLVWQGTALLFLRHSTYVYAHYLLYLMPGPFIIIGILLSTLMEQMQRLSFPWKRFVRYGLFGMIGLIVIIQTVGSAGWLVDHARGNFDSNYSYPQYFDLATIHRIVNTTDRIAQQRHLAHAYIGIHGDDEVAVTYMAQFAHTPMEVMDPNQCLVIPNVQSGPAVYVTDSNRPDLDALLKRYTLATQIGEIQHPGGVPFKVYILRARPEAQTPVQLSGGVQLISQKADVVSAGTGNPQLLVTRWNVQNTVKLQPRTTYVYRFLTHTDEKFVIIGVNGSPNPSEQVCRLSRTWAGDNLIPLFEFNGNAPQYLTMGIEKFRSIPKHYDYGSLQMVTFDNVNTRRVSLHTQMGKGRLTCLYQPQM